VEPFGLDEAWLDVTGSVGIFGSPLEIAQAISERIKFELGITASIGVSFNKITAKLGSDYKKPDAITVISRENFKTIVYPLPVGDLLFVGSKTASELNKIGVRTIGELAELEFEFLLSRFGKMGSLLYSYSRGLDESPVLSDADREDAKSISNGFTFKYDLTNKEQCRTAIDYLCDEIGCKLRSKEMKCTTVTLTVKDVYLKSIQRQRRLESETDISSEISNTAFSILCDSWPDGKAIRMITVGASGLMHSASEATQLDIFGAVDEKERERKRNVEKTVDMLRQKFGQSCVVRGSILQNNFGLGDDE
jgi:DNA polymerase-4